MRKEDTEWTHSSAHSESSGYWQSTGGDDTRFE